MQAEFLRRVQEFQARPEQLPLSDAFVVYRLHVVHGREIASGYTHSSLAVSKIELINRSGYMDILVWIVNHQAKTLFVSTEIYSRGMSGTDSGNGASALQTLSTLGRALATHSEYTIITLTSLNVGSVQLNERVGSPLSLLMKTDVQRFRQFVTNDQRLAWNEMLDSLAHNASYYRIDTPQGKPEATSQKSNEVVETLAAFLKLNPEATPQNSPADSSTPIIAKLSNLVRRVFT